MESLGLLYDDDGYVDAPTQDAAKGVAARSGLIGRQVAGQEFLSALFAHGHWETLVALVRNQTGADTLTRTFSRQTANDRRTRKLCLVPEESFLEQFHPDPPTRLLFTPCPPDLRYAWTRRHRSSAAYALCGVTHSLSTQRIYEWLGQLLTGPFEPYDALICTSNTALKMVRAATDHYAAFLKDRIGGDPRVRMRLAVIPLGVDTDRYHPPSPGERSARREALGISPDEIVVLFVGRLSHHTKAHPFPLFHALDQAARKTGRKIRLILSGWAHNEAVLQAFQVGATSFAPNVRVSFVDSTGPESRHTVWHAADIFSSLSDNIQETFGLSIIEALACGLPVVASEWDGYRDLVTDGETGFLIPTVMIPGATADATARMVLGSHSYDQYLAECSQAVAVDSAAAARAFTRLITDESERRRMGIAARRTVLQKFAWAEVIRAYEQLWREQEETRRDVEKHHRLLHDTGRTGLYPTLEVAFESYPTRWLDNEARLTATPGAVEKLQAMLTMPLVTHAAWARHTDPESLNKLLTAADGRTLAEVEATLSGPQTRATLAWMMKYDLLLAGSASDGIKSSTGASG